MNVPIATVVPIITLAFDICFFDKFSAKNLINDGHNIDIEKPFIIQTTIINVKLVVTPTIKFASAEQVRLIKIMYLRLYLPITMCLRGVEPPSKDFGDLCSIHLSYRHINKIVSFIITLANNL